jgi:hypothetical protein
MFESTPQWRQILRERAVLTDFGPASRAMKITAGADQQTELTGENRQAAHLLGGLMAIDHFDRVAPCLNIVGNQPATFAASEIVVPRMRQADPGLGGAQGFDRVFQGRPVLLDVPQLAGALPLSPSSCWMARAPSSAPGMPFNANFRLISSDRNQRPSCNLAMASTNGAALTSNP